MSRSFDSIKDINDEKELWKLAVRIEDIWKTGVGKLEHLEFLILDKQVIYLATFISLVLCLLSTDTFFVIFKGDNIQVMLPNDLCPLWEPKLKEGSTYVISNFRVQPNDFKVKLCDHPFNLVMVGGEGGTVLTPTELPKIPKYRLNFIPFSEIKRGNYKPGLLVGNVTHTIIILLYL
jgi:hypothetical protein